jgi:hypothetical protein
MWLLIVPIVIVLVVLLSVTALAASLFGALGSNWPWLLIALGAFLFWKEDGRHRHHQRRRAQHGWTPRTVPPTDPRTTDGAVSERVERLDKKAHAKSTRSSISTSSSSSPASAPTPLPRRTELPVDVQVKVEQIKRKVDVLLGFADRFPPFSKDLFLVQQTASDYLPRTVNAYLALPPDAVERPLPTTGQTPHQELRAQIDLLDSKLDEIAQDLERQDVARMLANRQFLEDRFGPAAEERATRTA